MEDELRTKLIQRELKEEIERNKIKAEGFLKNDIKAFIVDVNKTWYSCYIIFVGEYSLTIQNFEGDDVGINQRLYWADVKTINEYKKKDKSEPYKKAKEALKNLRERN
jgi:hypothetical protein